MGGFRIRNYIKGNNREFELLRKNHTELVKMVTGI